MKLDDLKALGDKLSNIQKRALLAGVLTLPILAYFAVRASCVEATPPEPPPAPVVTVTAAPQDGGMEQAPPEPPKTTATITFIVSPSVQAQVMWGRKRLGIIKPGHPLIVTRPRDSGPLDVVVKADGYLPVQTRAYTFNDSKMIVKLTKPEAMNTLLGYRVPIEAGLPLGMDPDAGVNTAGAVPAPWP